MKILGDNVYHLNFHIFFNAFLLFNQKVIFFSQNPLLILGFLLHLNFILNLMNFLFNFIIKVNQLNKHHQNS